MKREIKFKAKQLNSGKWFEGDLVHLGNRVCIGGDHIIDGITDVDPSTVCQFTGLKDINGVEVYENDIVKAVDWEETICNVEYKDYGFCLCGECFRDGVMPLFVAVGNCDIYVVGNKFDKKK